MTDSKSQENLSDKQSLEKTEDVKVANLGKEKNLNSNESGYGAIANKYKSGKHSIAKESIVEFEKTWGHRLLMGISILMLVLAVIVVLYCSLALAKILGNGGLDTTEFLSMVATTIYVFGIIAFALMIPPAIFGIVVSKHPKLVVVAYVFSGIAILLLVALLIYIIATHGLTLFAFFAFFILPLVLPVLYLVSSIKIGKSNHIESKHKISSSDKS